MTMIDNDVDEIVGVDDGCEHVVCCKKKEQFVCGAPYHPEAAASEDTGECCPDCAKAKRKWKCIGHSHCPLDVRVMCPR